MGQEEVIARRYAKGLIEFAQGNDAVTRIRQDIKHLADVVDPGAGELYVPELRNFLTSPVAEPKDKIAFAGAILDKCGIGPEVKDFLGVMIRNNRVELIPRVARAFSDLAGPLTGVHSAMIQTARQLTPEQIERLQGALSTALGATVQIHQQVEPGLLAGAKIIVGDKTIDGSVLGKLERLRHRLTDPEALQIADEPEEGEAEASA